MRNNHKIIPDLNKLTDKFITFRMNKELKKLYIPGIVGHLRMQRLHLSSFSAQRVRAVVSGPSDNQFKKHLEFVSTCPLSTWLSEVTGYNYWIDHTWNPLINLKIIKRDTTRNHGTPMWYKRNYIELLMNLSCHKSNMEWSMASALKC